MQVSKKFGWIREFVDNPPKLVSYFLPSFHNRITWFVVATGVTLVGGNVLETIFLAYFEKQFDLDAYIPNHTELGFLLVVIALIYNLVFQLVNQQKSPPDNLFHAEKTNHDRNLFARLELICREEKLIKLLEWIGDDHSIYDTDRRLIDNIIGFSALAENSFADKETEVAWRKFGEKLNLVDLFLRNEFDAYGNGPRRLVMRQDLCQDRGGISSGEELGRYEELGKKLNIIIDESENAFREFRLILKHRSFV